MLRKHAHCILFIAITIAMSAGLLAESNFTKLGSRLRIQQYPKVDIVLFFSESTGNRVEVYKGSTLAKIVIDVESGTVVALVEPKSIIKGLADVSDDGSLLVTGGRMKEGNDIGLEIIDVLAGKTISTIQVESDGLYGVFFLNDKSRVGICGAKGIRVYDYRRNRMVAEFPKPEVKKPKEDEGLTPVTAAAAMSWRDEVATGGEQFPSRVLRAIAHDPLTGRLALSNYQTVEIWDSNKETMLWSTVLDGNSISELAFSPVGRRLAVGMYDGRIRVITFDQSQK